MRSRAAVWCERSARVLAAQLRASLLVAARYRADFLVDGAVEILWTATTLAPLGVLLGAGRPIAGWSFEEVLVVVGFFTWLQAVLEGVLLPSFGAAIELARSGNLDHLLMKPADAQLLLSTARVLPWRAVNLATGLALFVVAFARRGAPPSLGGVAAASLAFAASLAILHGVFSLALASVFVWTRTDGVADLLTGLLEGARWPVAVYRGALRLALTYALPYGLLTTFPAEGALGRLEPRAAVLGGIEAAALWLLGRAVFRRALGAYRSASS